MLVKYYIPARLESVIHCVKVACCAQWGGYTTYAAVGGWCPPDKSAYRDGSIVEEPVVVIESACHFATAAGDAVDIAKYQIAPLLDQAGEKEFMYMVDNHPYTINLSKEIPNA